MTDLKNNAPAGHHDTAEDSEELYCDMCHNHLGDSNYCEECDEVRHEPITYSEIYRQLKRK